MGVLQAAAWQGTAFAFLLLAHVLSDFVFQTDRMVRDKSRASGLVRHGLVVLSVHVVLWIPFIDFERLVALVVLVLAHLAFDAWKVGALAKGRPRAPAFVVDQLLHLASLGLVWWFLVHRRPMEGPYQAAVPSWLVGPEAAWLAVVASAVAFLWVGAGALLRDLLDDLRVERPRDGRGRVIGILERWIVLVAVLASQWAVLGFVIAAKAIVRFDEVRNNRPFAELFLIGTLASVLVAIVVAVGVRWLVG